MFFINPICRTHLIRWLIVAVATGIIAILPTVAQAAGETYVWKDAQHSAIIAQGGPYAAATEFAKVGTAYTTAALTLTCNDGTTAAATGSSKITGSGSSFAINNSALTAAAGCVSAPFNATFAVAAAPAAAAASASAITTTTPPASGSCDQGDFTWLACPIMGSIASTISKLATGALTPFLEISPLSSGKTAPLYVAWTHLRDFADVLFIFIFLAIIISTTIQTGLDQYTVKRLLPRLIAAVILVQLSYFLIGIVVDIGNVAGAGVDGLLVTVVNPSSGGHSVANFFGDVGALGLALYAGSGAFVTLAGGAAILPLLLGILIGVFAVFLTLMARYVIIAVLIVLAPLAIVAWVLPNTESYYKKWLSALLRLVMMYPIIIAILSIAGRIDQLLPFNDTGLTGTPAFFTALIKPVVIIVAFMMVPATFKWAASALGGVGKMMTSLAGRATKGYKNTDFWKDGVNARSMNKSQHMLNKSNRATLLRDPDKAQQILSQDRSKLRRMNDGFIMSGVGKRTQGMRMGMRGLALGGAPSSGLDLQRSYNSQFNSQVKDLTDLENSEATPDNLKTAFQAMYGGDPAERATNMTKLRQSAPSLVRYTNNVQGRAAITRRLSEYKMINDDLTRRAMSDPRAALEYNQFIGNRAAKADPSGKPEVTFARQYDNTRPQNTNFIEAMASGRISGMSAHGFSETFDIENFNAGIGKNVGKDPSKRVELYTQDDLSKTVAKTFLDNASFSALGKNFTARDRDVMDANKRVAIVRLLQANETQSAAGNAKLVRTTVLDKVLTGGDNNDIFNTLSEVAIRSGFTNDPLGRLSRLASADDQVTEVTNWSDLDKEAFLRRWLNF